MGSDFDAEGEEGGGAEEEGACDEEDTVILLGPGTGGGEGEFEGGFLWGEAGLSGGGAEFFRGHIAFTFDGDEEEVVGDGAEEAEVTEGVLIGEEAGDEGQGAVIAVGADELGEGGGFVGVMADIDDDEGLLGNDLATAGPTDAGEAGTDSILGKVVVTEGMEEVESGDGEGGVTELEIAEEGECEGFPGAVWGFDGEFLAGVVHSEAADRDELVGAEEGAVTAGGDGLEDLLGGAGLWVEEDGAGGFDDAGFFGGDFFEGGAEDGGMFEAEVCDDGEEWGEDVGGIEAAAEAGFDDSEVDLATEEPGKSDGGGEFEEGSWALTWGGGLAGVCGFGLIEEGIEGVIGDGEAGDTDTLIEADEVGAGVEGGFEAAGTEGGFEHSGGASLTAGSSDMDAGDGGGVDVHFAEEAQGCAEGIFDEVAALSVIEVGQFCI